MTEYYAGPSPFLKGRPSRANSSNGSHTVAISAYGLPLALAVVAVLLTLAYAASKLAVGCPGCEVVETYLHLDREANLPTWFASTLWLVSAAVAALVAATSNMFRWHWNGLVGICLFLSLDEASMFHERFGAMFGSAVSAGDYLYYNWLGYAAVVLVVVGLTYLPFLLSLPRGTAIRISLAGILFVSGAVGVEFLGGASRAGAIDLIEGRALWGLQLMSEELLEMLGIITLIHALLHHLAVNLDPVTFGID